MYKMVTLSVLLLAVTVVNVRVRAQAAPSDNLLNFLATFNGDFTSGEDSSRELFLTFFPVDVPALYPLVVYVMKGDVNGETKRLALVGISEMNDGVIRVQTFTLTAEAEEQTQDLVQLKELKAEDLLTDSSCDILLKPVEPTVFMGTWPVCHPRDPEQTPNVVGLTTCTGITWQTFFTASSTTTQLPHTLKRIKKYPLLVDKPDYVDPCGN